MNKTIKKIVALGMGATMLAATAGIALATDLSNYPAPFVSNGVFVGKLVIGEKAASADVIGALDIAASLQRAASTAVVQGAGTATSVAGGYALATSSQMIYFGAPFGVQTVTSNGLSLLSDNQFYDQQGTSYSYTQTIKLSQQQNLTYSQHLGSNVDSFLGFDLSTYVSPTTSYLYADKVDFSKTINATSSNVIGQTITLFGKQYTFSSESSGNTLIMYGSSETVTLTPTDTVTKTINGNTYTIKVLGFSSSADNNGDYSVSVQVNGDTKTITQGSSAVFPAENNLKIFAQTVSSWNQGNSGVATLQLGADKLTLQDGHTVETGTSDTSIQGTLVQINGGGGTAGAVNSLYVYINGQQSSGPTSYIKSGNSFVDPVFGTFQVQYAGENFPVGGSASDTVKVQASGSTQAFATVTPFTGSSSPVNVYFDYSNSAAHSLMWSPSTAIHSFEGDNVPVNDYLYLSPNTDTDTSHTHLVQLTSISLDHSSGYVEFQDILNPSAATYKTLQGQFNTTGDSTTFTVDGYTYTVKLTGTNQAIAGGKGVTVAVTEASATTQVFPAFEALGGEWVSFVGNVGTNISFVAGSTTVQLPTGLATIVNGSVAGSMAQYTGDLNSNFKWNVTANTTTIVGITPASGINPAVLIVEPKDYNNKQSVWYVPTTGTGASTNFNIGSALYSQAGSYVVPSFQPMADTYTTSAVDYYGTFVKNYAPSGNNANQVTVFVPPSQMFANVFVAPTGAATSTTSATGAVSLNPISVGMAILDSDAKLGGTTPYIVVGGPCANTVSAALMNNPTDCAAGFTEGKATIKLFSSQNALLVAGYSAADTQGACRVLASYSDPQFKLSGTEVSVVTTNLNSLSIQKVSS